MGFSKQSLWPNIHPAIPCKMGPFEGRFLQVSTSVLDGSRPGTQRSVQIDTRLMSQWMESMHHCGVSIENVSAISEKHSSFDNVNKKPVEREVKEKKSLIASISMRKQKEQNDASSSQTDEGSKSKKRRNRRK